MNKIKCMAVWQTEKKVDLCRRVGWILSFMLFFGMYIFYIKESNPTVPYMDSVRLVGQLFDMLTGNVAWYDIWRSSGPAIFYHVVTMLEWIMWGLDSRITVLLTAIAWATIFFVYALEYNKLYINGNWRISVSYVFALQMLFAYVFFSPAGWEIWLLDLGFPQVLKNLLIIFYFLKLSKANLSPSDFREAAFFGLLGSLIVLLISAGWSYAFTATVLLFTLFYKRNSTTIILLALPIVASQFIFSIFATGASALGSMAISSNGSGMIQSLKSFLFGLSSIFVGIETVERIDQPYLFLSVGCFFLLVIVYTFIFYSLRLRKHDANFFSLIFLFGVLTLGSISIARGGQGYYFAAASRYFMDYQCIFFGFCGMFFNVASSLKECANLSHKEIISRNCILKVMCYFSCGIFLLVFLGQSMTYVDEYRKAPYRALAYSAMADVYLEGRTDDQAVRLLQTSKPELTKAQSVFKEFGLGVFRGSR